MSAGNVVESITGVHPYADKFPMLPGAGFTLEGRCPDLMLMVQIVESEAHPGYYDVRIYTDIDSVHFKRPCSGSDVGRAIIARFVESETDGAALKWKTTESTGQAKRTLASVVYFIRDEDGYIKIGTAVSARYRLNNLQTAHRQELILLATLPGGRSEELALHHRFASSHVRGEWFAPTPELLSYVREVSA